MELDFGSNIIRNSNGILMADGRQQMELEVGEDGQALLTMEVYDEAGTQIAKLRRNAWVTNEEDRFAITTAPASLRLINKQTDEVVVEVNVVSRTNLRIPQGRFFTPGGMELVIAPDALTIGGGISVSGNLLDSNNQAFVIEPTGIGLGA